MNLANFDHGCLKKHNIRMSQTQVYAKDNNYKYTILKNKGKVAGSRNMWYFKVFFIFKGSKDVTFYSSEQLFYCLLKKCTLKFVVIEMPFH